jgi:hypothetical protein
MEKAVREAGLLDKRLLFDKKWSFTIHVIL